MKGKGNKMKKKLTKVLAFVGALAMTLSMNTLVFAADDDIVLDGAGDAKAALQKTIDPGTDGEYKYIGWAYVGDSDPAYKYLKLTYTGDAECFEQIRLEMVEPDDDPNGPGVLQKIVWFGENDEGSFKTVDGKNCPAASDKEQTVWIDLEKSGFDLSKGIRAFHIHSTPGLGTVTFKEAVLSKTAEGLSDEQIKKDQEEKTTVEETTKEIKLDNIYPDSEDTSDSSSSNSWILPVAIVAGAVVIAVIAVVVVKNGKKEGK